MENSLTVKQLAERWGFCTLTIRQMEKAGKVRGFRLGRNLRFRLEEVVKVEGGTAESSDDGIGDAILVKATQEANLAEQKERKATANNKKGEAELAMVLRDAGMTAEELEEKVKAFGGDLLEAEGLMDEINALHKKSKTGMPQEFRPPLKKLMVLIYKRLGKDTGENTEEGVE